MAVLQKKKKVKKTFSRRLGGGYSSAPMENFWNFKDYARTEVDKKETAKVIKEYIRKKFSKSDAKLMLENPDWIFAMPYYIAATIVWANLEKEIPANWNHKPLFKKYFDDLKVRGKVKVANKTDEPKVTPSRSPMEIVKQRTSDFIGSIDEILDDWSNGNYDEQYSVFNELQKENMPYNTAKGVYDYYKPILDEINELIVKKSKDLVEAYDHMTLKKKKEYQKLLSFIVDDAEKYMLTKKAKKTIKLPKKLTADKQVKKINFLPQSSEYKLASISPVQIPNSYRLYTFNVKNKKLTEYVATSYNGFEISGSTLKKVDLEASRTTTLRKPDEFLSIVMKKTPNQINVAWKKLTTKTTTPTPRINKDTLILRTLNK